MYQITKPNLSEGGPAYLSWYGDSLRAERSGDRIPVGARFSAPVQKRTGAHPAYTKNNGSLVRGKRGHLVSRLKKE